MPIVPIRPQARVPTALAKPPDPTYLMMAAAQMHAEGRLIQPGSEPQGPPQEEIDRVKEYWRQNHPKSPQPEPRRPSDGSSGPAMMT